ncbi:AzlD family protein [Arenibaculum sp.]|jgi:uncharacterized membrane protein|uniref:AzlD family protein n=1 Tax=Arenibaculum sp. TaxID=2865862 RepID=UPI002E142DFE|nr:AzlD domain-containing protein [Arenibaculum sp.]
MDGSVVPALVALGIASFACRASGFFLMRYAPRSARLDRTLEAMPLCVMLGIVAPAAVRGSVPELVGIAAAGLAMALSGRDLVSALAGVAAVAAARLVVSA